MDGEGGIGEAPRIFIRGSLQTLIYLQRRSMQVIDGMCRWRYLNLLQRRVPCMCYRASSTDARTFGFSGRVVAADGEENVNAE